MTPARGVRGGVPEAEPALHAADLLLLGALDVEDIAELHDGAVHIALFQKLESGLIIFLGLLCRALAGRKRQTKA